VYENGKMRHIETTPGMGVEKTKENDGGDELNYKFCNCTPSTTIIC
jgi:hypothetical protein